MRRGEFTPDRGNLTRLLLDVVFQLVFAQLDVFKCVVGHKKVLSLWLCEELVEQYVGEEADERTLNPRLAVEEDQDE